MILEGLHLDPSLYIPDFAAKGISVTQSLVTSKEPALSSCKVMMPPQEVQEFGSGPRTISRAAYQVNGKECHVGIKKPGAEKRYHCNGSVAVNDLTVIPAELEPIFIPVVVTMNQGDHQLLSRQWCSDSHRDSGLDFQSIFQQVKLLDRYIQKTACKGVAAVSVDISSPSSALDYLHDHFLDCVEVAMEMR